MMLIVAEKPSVGRAIAEVLGARESHEGYLEGHGVIVTWCVGHLVELALPEDYNPDYAHWKYKDLPIIPDQWKYNISKGSAKQFEIVRSLMNEERVTEIICATDAGREGELIFRLVYLKTGCRKPVRRLWVSSLEASAIRQGMSNLKSITAYDNLFAAALCRAQADWLIGMNATRLFSLLYGPTLHIGRVMTPTLAMLAERENAIEHFVPETFYTVKLNLGPGMSAHSERIHELSAAQRLMTACNATDAIVKMIERKQKRESPPPLYDLTTLQRDANRFFGFSAQQTLDYAQALYEKKLLTYPRTDSRYLSNDMLPKISGLASRVQTAMPFANGLKLAGRIEQVVNDQKVTDHHAIIPTEFMPGQMSAVNGLPAEVRDVLGLVCVRLLCAIDDPLVYDETTVVVECAGTEFSMKGRKILQMGWKRIWEAFRGSNAGRIYNEKQDAEAPIPDDITEGSMFALPRAELSEGKTTPPARYTEDTILHAMETAGATDIPEDAEHRGIGTPATRAAIIEKLIETKLIERSGDRHRYKLVPTSKGKALASVLPDKLLSPQLTAEWEQRLKRIEKGVEQPIDFMRDIREYTEDALRKVLEGKHIHIPKTPRRDYTESQIKRLVDIEAKLREGKGKGYMVWAERNNIDAKAQSIIYLKENHIGSIAELNQRITALRSERNHLNASIRRNQNRMKEINELRKAIRDYSRTKDVYTHYRESGWSLEFYQEHRREIEAHKQAQEMYSMHDGKMPTLKDLSAEYDTLREQKSADIAAVEKLKPQLTTLNHIKYNFDILERDCIPASKERHREQKSER